MENSGDPLLLDAAAALLVTFVLAEPVMIIYFVLALSRLDVWIDTNPPHPSPAHSRSDISLKE